MLLLHFMPDSYFLFKIYFISMLQVSTLDRRKQRIETPWQWRSDARGISHHRSPKELIWSPHRHETSTIFSCPFQFKRLQPTKVAFPLHTAEALHHSCWALGGIAGQNRAHQESMGSKAGGTRPSTVGLEWAPKSPVISAVPRWFQESS